MKAQELQALMVDWHLGELRPEVEALLEAYLAQNPGAREESGRIEETLAVTKKAVQAHPELVPSPSTDLKEAVKSSGPLTGRGRRVQSSWLKIAAALALAAGSCLVGYQVGSGNGLSQLRPELVSSEEAPAPAPEVRPALAVSASPSPWAKYRISGNGEGSGLLFTRMDDR